MKLKDKLYPIFKDWCFEGTIWVIGDTHFKDEESRLLNPDWPTDEQIINNINSKVKKKDTLIILGDVGDPSCVKKLNGYKILVTGNHDKGVSNYQRVEEYVEVANNMPVEDARTKFKNFRNFIRYAVDKIAYCDNQLFDEVYDGPVFIGKDIVLSHEPIKLNFGYNIHGHTHEAPKFEHWANSAVSYNVCSDVINWTPVRLDSILAEFNDITTIHRLTINKRKK